MNAVDTNVLVYAYGESAPDKRAKARALMASLPEPILLWQVALEFLAASRKLATPGDSSVAWERLSEVLSVFALIMPTPATLERAKEIQARTRAQFWDTMIYAACQEAGVTTLYSEDLPGAAVPGLTIVNPFA